ncbi:MAG: hypothetical protein K1W24_01260 [Lachnospiraceae bacterium]
MEDKKERLIVNEKNVDCIKLADRKYLKQLTSYDCNIESLGVLDITYLKQLMFYDCNIKNLDALVKLPLLKGLTFARCSFGTEDLQALCKAPSLTRLNLNETSTKGIASLQSVKSLKRLALWNNIKDIKFEDLSALQGLHTLEIYNIHDKKQISSAFIKNLVNLRKLQLNHNILDNLDFLVKLPKLYKFCLLEPAKNEDGLMAVKDFTNLKEFIYPVKDLSIYKDCPGIKKIGIAPCVKSGFEALEGSQVNEFIICGSVSWQQVKKVAGYIEKYVKLECYGSQG